MFRAIIYCDSIHEYFVLLYFFTFLNFDKTFVHCAHLAPYTVKSAVTHRRNGLMSDDDDALDIYSGVVTDASTQRIRELEEQLRKANSDISVLQGQRDKLSEENSALKSKVKVLESNISCLYKTAVAEIQRKDELVKTLRETR